MRYFPLLYKWLIGVSTDTLMSSRRLHAGTCELGDCAVAYSSSEHKWACGRLQAGRQKLWRHVSRADWHVAVAPHATGESDTRSFCVSVEGSGETTGSRNLDILIRELTADRDLTSN